MPATNFTVWFAITFWIYIETQSVFATGMVAGIFLVFTAAFGIWLGAIVDHNSKRLAMMGSSLVSFVFYAAAIAMVLLEPEGAFSDAFSPYLWVFVLVVMLGVIAGNIRSIALPTIVTIMIPEDERDKANGLVGMVTGIGFLTTSVISGFLVAWGGMYLVLMLAIAATALVFFHLFFLRLNEGRPVPVDGQPAEPKRVDIAGTIAVIAAVPGLFALIFFATFNNFLGGIFMALLDAYGLSLVPVEVWGLLFGVLSTAFIASGLLISRIGLGRNPLKLAPRPVTVLSPMPLGSGASSAWAQGGVAAAVGEGDTAHAHARDTEMAGAGIVDHGVAESVTGEAAARIDDLANWGTPFDRDALGQFILSREAAHSANRVVRVSGDRAGHAIMQAIIAKVRQTPSIRVLEGITAVDLAHADGRIVGVFCRRLGDRYVEPVFIRARATVLAAGGLGGLYAVTTNPPSVRGHAMGMAARAGAIIADPEFVQFHPTAILTGRDPAPLATEALRGEGAILVNDLGERFMEAIHPDAELAPRDIVARANFREIQRGRKVFLDTRQALGGRIVSAYPTVVQYCQAAGIDPVTDPIPVTPAAHYHMGGVKVDEDGRSSLPGLWVCGEASCTGLHGANRLASNSLLEAIVYGARIAEDISGLEPRRRPLPDFAGIAWDAEKGARAEEVLRNLKAVKDIRATMSADVGVERDAEGLKRALRTLLDLEETALEVTRAYLNMISSATLVAAAALKRTESRGGHFRTDFPQTSADWQTHTEMTLAEARAIRAEA